MSDVRYMQPCPPLVETVSYRGLPCRFEQRAEPPTGETDPEKKRCPEFEFCKLSSRVLWRFELVFGRWLKVTLSEPSSSIVVRSEHHFNREERRRLSLRKHIYELSADHGDSLSRTRRKPIKLGKAFLTDLEGKVGAELLSKLTQFVESEFVDIQEFESSLRSVLSKDEFKKFGTFIVARAFSPLDCYRIQKSDQFGHYAGFVDLRPNSIGSPLAFAVLGIPRKYRHNADCFLITGNYGPLFGGPSFNSTVYSMHDPRDGGALCAQACVMMALGLLADRGAQVSGTHTLTYLGKRKRDLTLHLPEEVEDEGNRIGYVANGKHLGKVPRNDSPRQSFAAAGGLGGLEPDRIATLLQDRGVSSRYLREKSNPESGRLLERLIEAYIVARSPVILAVDSRTWWPWSKTGASHAVIVVGTRRLADSRNELALITHDPGFIPFYERRFSECQASCSEYDGAGEFSVIFVAHKSVKRHAYDCVLALQSDRSPDRDVFAKYLHAEKDSSLDYQIALVVRDNLAETFYSRSQLPDRQYVKRLQRELEGRLVRARYWCIAALEGKKLKAVWMFDAAGRTEVGPVAWDAKLTFGSRKVEIAWVNNGSVEATVLKDE